MEEAGISVLSIERGGGGGITHGDFGFASSTGSVWVRIELWECFGTRILTQCPVRPQSSPIMQFDTKPTQSQRATSKCPIWNCFYDYNRCWTVHLLPTIPHRQLGYGHLGRIPKVRKGRSDLSAAVIDAFSGRDRCESP